MTDASMTQAAPTRHFSVAPMMDWTDTWCRRFHRVLTRRAVLFTEMVVDQAIVRGDQARLLAFTSDERPLVLQLGGSDPQLLAQAAQVGASYSYDEINLNVGCPSDRVQGGRFGACLMLDPAAVAAAMDAMARAVDVPVSVKCRIGVDDQDPRTALFDLVTRCADVGVRRFYVHARKAWLKGLSPKENRDVPPLDYGLVHELKAARPDLEIILNGGLADLVAAEQAGGALDGVMLGRAAYQNPWLLAQVDAQLYGDTPPVATRRAAAEALVAIVDEAVAQGRTAHAVTRHALGLFHGAPGARSWRRVLSTEAVKPGVGGEVVLRALEAVEAAGAAVEAAR